jgi:hypothetical protein
MIQPTFDLPRRTALGRPDFLVSESMAKAHYVRTGSMLLQVSCHAIGFKPHQLWLTFSRAES